MICHRVATFGVENGTADAGGAGVSQERLGQRVVVDVGFESMLV